MATLANIRRMTTATSGTGTITLGSAVSGFKAFGSGLDGETVTYVIEEGSNREIGRGVYTHSGTTLTRSVLESTNADAAINLSGGAEVYIDAAAEDFVLDPTRLSTSTPVDGFGSARNLGLAASVGSNALTIAIKGADGNDPSDTNPVLIPFRHSTIATGTPVWRSITAANSLVISSGSTLGATSGEAFRVWIVAFDDGGTVRLGAINCLGSGVKIHPIAEWTLGSSTAEGGAGAADSAGVIYTGTAVTSKSFRILGFVEYSSGLTTAGTWNIVPTTTQLFGPGVPRPGQIVQTSAHYDATGSASTSTTYVDVTNGSVSITPTSAINPISVIASASFRITQGGAGTNATGSSQLLRGATALLLESVGVGTGSGINALSNGCLSYSHVDLPQTTSSTTYKLQHKKSGGTSTVTTAYVTFIVQEIMA